ncbi:DUF1768 domain-containing protein [Cohnella sp. CFH 77786]|uniref:NADAR family protein n=1 Tax=Cohnella sp. CFH 77786 TaxID=2662265 RepID=UPI001C60A9A2|nr:NADAR family protein [Cohnella sp. CFH 77786]MBW5447656.1 DUF1768 domain-containing protein [Cohnella sp. CFH 77786]
MEKFTFFWRTESPFSQWHPARFEAAGIVFQCAEQYMMYEKAKLFGDEDVASQILRTNSPVEQKKLGRKVKSFDQAKWEAECKRIVYEGNYAKFTQNQALLQKLLQTAGTTLVEASPVDCIWGIGLAEDDPRSRHRKTWRGKNWLGEVLTQLREDLLNKEGSSE